MQRRENFQNLFSAIPPPIIFTRYVYSGSRLLEEYDSATNTLLKRYVYAGDDEALCEIDGAGNVTYLHQDHQNSLIARANGAGTLTAKYEYSPWGEASLPGTGFGYTGQRWDADLGLYNYKARYYDPVKGRFLQPDPVGYKQDMNLYTYCVNDPVNMVDPDGSEGEEAAVRYVRALGNNFGEYMVKPTAARAPGYLLQALGPGGKGSENVGNVINAMTE